MTIDRWTITHPGDEIPRQIRMGLLALDAVNIDAAQQWFELAIASPDPHEVLGGVVGLAGVAYLRSDHCTAGELLRRAFGSGRLDAALHLGQLAVADYKSAEANKWFSKACTAEDLEVRWQALCGLRDLAKFDGDSRSEEKFSIQAAETDYLPAIRYEISRLHHHGQFFQSRKWAWRLIQLGETDDAVYEVLTEYLLDEAEAEWTLPSRLNELATDFDWRVRQAVALNATTPTATRTALQERDDEAKVREAAAGPPSAPKKVDGTRSEFGPWAQARSNSQNLPAADQPPTQEETARELFIWKIGLRLGDAHGQTAAAYRKVKDQSWWGR